MSEAGREGSGVGGGGISVSAQPTGNTRDRRGTFVLSQRPISLAKLPLAAPSANNSIFVLSPFSPSPLGLVLFDETFDISLDTIPLLGLLRGTHVFIPADPPQPIDAAAEPPD